MKAAMIGSWGHANTVLDAIADDAEMELAAVARFGPDDKLGYLGQHRACPAGTKVYDDYRDLLDKEDVDVVGVFMPLYRNAEVSTAAAMRGIHVLSEKPLATRWEDLQRLREAVDKAGVHAAALMDMRTWPAFQAARQAVVEERIGRPLLAAAQKSYPFASRDKYYKTRETYGGSILWQAVHAIDFALYVTGLDVARVSATASNLAHPTHPGMEDAGAMWLDFVGGGHASVWFDYLRPWPGEQGRRWGDDRLRLAGSEATVEVVDCGQKAILLTKEDMEVLPLPEKRSLPVEFFDQIRDRSSCIISKEESFRLTEICLAGRDAADSGSVVTLG
ncbi:MAG: Gfo/Idh/MocA family protein [Phycisphaerae bacterium]